MTGSSLIKHNNNLLQADYIFSKRESRHKKKRQKAAQERKKEKTILQKETKLPG